MMLPRQELACCAAAKKIIMTLSAGDMRSEGKLHGQIYRRFSTQDYKKEKYYMNIGTLKHFSIYNFKKLKKIFKVSTLWFHTGAEDNRLHSTTTKWGLIP